MARVAAPVEVRYNYIVLGGTHVVEVPCKGLDDGRNNFVMGDRRNSLEEEAPDNVEVLYNKLAFPENPVVVDSDVYHGMVQHPAVDAGNGH